ncbi:MAG: hypothetical protein PHY99_10465, partial [Bacteroidales bacterium]|nr:hypothetical protein [Bacteroidales bacterium]
MAKQLIIILLSFLTVTVSFAQRSAGQVKPLPFTLTVTKTPVDSLPDYLTDRSPDEWMDFPVAATRIDGEFWVMLKNGETKPAYRFKGTNFENAKRQPDGVISAPVSRPYILGGMWYDKTDQKLYAPMHCETRGYYTTILRQITLASSTDKGATWKYEGPIMTRDNPDEPLPTSREGSGLYWDGGEGDFYLYADEKEGYVYLYTNHYVWTKTGVDGPPFGFFTFIRHHVARCAIKDKLAPGKWQKFYNGSWTEPALGGKASDVEGCYVMYNTYLKKYISFNYNSSISFCTDLSKQDWSPSYKIPGDIWGCPPASAWHVLNAEKNDVYRGGQSLWLYSYWEKKFYGLYKIDLGSGKTQPTEGYSAGYAGAPITSMEPGGLYLYGSRYESDDPVESRRTRRVACTHKENVYSGTWTDEPKKEYYESMARVSSENKSQVEFSFTGTDIYWRVVKGPDCGKADIYIDNSFQQTIDCYSSPMTPYQFGFIRKGLDPTRPHVIKIMVKGEKNEKSSGTAIKHVLFEYSAGSYRASDGFCNMMGKNCWLYQQIDSTGYSDLVFKDPYWTGNG